MMSWWQNRKEVPSSSTDFSRPCPKNGYYDVFLSFRGEDTRYGFTHNLYHFLREKKIHTFMDVDLTGEDIDYLFKMVEKSRMAVVIYSESFASSDWCLRELDLILQRRNENKMLVIPIFYKVNVHEVKHLTGKTAECLDKLLSKHDETTVQKWKEVITSFGNVSGLSYKNSHARYEYDFIMDVIAKIKKKLQESEENPESYIGKPHVENIRIRDNHMIEKGSASHQTIEISPIPQVQQEHIDSTQLFSRTNTTTGDEEFYRVVTSAYFQKSVETTGKLLNIKPSNLNFIVEPEKSSSTCLILTNKTDNHVIFMIQLTRPLKYHIYPSEGLVLARSTCKVIVTMEAQTMLPSDMVECRDDKFLVQSVIATQNSSSTDDFSNMFTEESGNTIENCWMGVVCVAPPEQVSSIPDHISQLANKGLVHGSEAVIYIDLHPTKPWLLLGLVLGSVCIWNYETRTEEKSFKVDDEPVICAKFVHEKHWIVVGARNGFVRVFDYNTLEKVTEFKAHGELIIGVAVHPTSPYVFTTSDDKSIKLWNWENDWACADTFEGHSHYVMQVAFNPKDSSSFATVSWDGTIKIWIIGSSVAKFTLDDGHAEGLNCVEYFVGNDDKLYLLSGSDYFSVRIWDYESKTLVQTLEGHSHSVTTILVHPKLPFILTGSTDKTIRVWNKNTYWPELVWSCELGQVWSIKFIKSSNEVVLGCDDGMIVIKIVDA